MGNNAFWLGIIPPYIKKSFPPSIEHFSIPSCKKKRGFQFHQTLPRIQKNWETFPQWFLANFGKYSPLDFTEKSPLKLKIISNSISIKILSLEIKLFIENSVQQGFYCTILCCHYVTFSVQMVPLFFLFKRKKLINDYIS